MYYDLGGGIIHVISSVSNGLPVFDPSSDFIKTLFDGHIRGYIEYTEVVRHCIIRILTSLLLEGQNKSKGFYQKWNSIDHKGTLIPRRYFFELYTFIDSLLSRSPFERDQFIKTTELLYNKIQLFLKDKYNINSTFSVYSGLVYDSDLTLKSEIDSFVISTDIYELLKRTYSTYDKKRSSKKKRSYRARRSVKGNISSARTERQKATDKYSQKQDAYSLDIDKSSLRYKKALIDSDEELYKILTNWNSVSNWPTTKTGKSHRAARRKILKYLSSITGADLNKRPTRSWKRIMRLLIPNLKSYNLIQKLDSYLSKYEKHRQKLGSYSLDHMNESI